MTTLKGRTLFITGASRGIGKAIALRAAQDGANVVIAAKTERPHPRLEGTIHSAAEAIRAAGGAALAIPVDVRDEAQIHRAVQQAVATFGGIDVLVNNASAIQLTGTLDTELRRFDLMHQVNTRGAFACGQACIPHLMRAENPHILSISPPLDFADHWWGRHLPWVMAKYGMSLCIRAWAEEFRQAGIAANALWPRTTIATAAMAMLSGLESFRHCRKPEIVGEAAHWILTRPSRQCTGRFLLDDQALAEAGVTDFDRYSVEPGETLRSDLLVDDPGGFDIRPMEP